MNGISNYSFSSDAWWFFVLQTYNSNQRTKKEQPLKKMLALGLRVMFLQLCTDCRNYFVCKRGVLGFGGSLGEMGQRNCTC